MAVPPSFLPPTSIVRRIVEILEPYHGRILESRTLASLLQHLLGYAEWRNFN